MFSVNYPNGKVLHITKIDSKFKINELWNHLHELGFEKENYYLTHQGRLVYEDSEIEGYVTINPKFLGGKGGFGSMLRAIGAQIEKTTNREACRDLSGRRLRDINEEKRLKAWIEKQASRDNEAAERKKRKLERLCAEPNYKFEDKDYECERSLLTEKVDNAVEEGLKITKMNDTVSVQKEISKKGVKRKTILDDDEDFDDDDDDEDEDDNDVHSSDKSNSSNSSSPSKKIKMS
ncbi:replication stress response regulator SDE2 [Chelonus insularis]|uniref:replication stress response regulator SDE2 n=1 Tax=Chelonus insularis TaxID=460826 RepID=UPI0015897BC9|nr:replication stress response regulator SDE2 [Chelonus insularis]